MFRTAITVLCVSLLPIIADGQALYRTLRGDLPGDEFGSNIALLGDLDADGIPDFSVSATTPANPAAAYVRVFSGRYLQPLFTIPAPAGSGAGFGSSVVSAGDWNGDGTGDLAVMTPAPFPGVGFGVLRIYSGLDGSLLKSITSQSATSSFGAAMAAVGDHDGDGRVDYIVGAPLDDTFGPDFGAAFIISSFTGVKLRTYAGTSTNSSVGFNVANVGDINADGVDDHGVSGDGVRIYSGDTGLLLTIYPFADFGRSLAGIGDINNDGIGDYITSRPPGCSTSEVQVRSGADSDFLSSLTSPWNFFDLNLGLMVGPAGDYDGDGTPDYYFSAHGYILFTNFNGTSIHSGATHQELTRYFSTLPYSAPESCAALGDLNGDGHMDYAIGDKDISSGTGSVRVNYGKTEAVELYHTTNATLTEDLELVWQATPGLTPPLWSLGQLYATGATPGALGLVAASFAPADFVAHGLPILLSFDAPNLAITGVLGATALGEFEVGNLYRANPLLAGLPIYIQLYELSPIRRASNGLRIVFTD